MVDKTPVGRWWFRTVRLAEWQDEMPLCNPFCDPGGIVSETKLHRKMTRGTASAGTLTESARRAALGQSANISMQEVACAAIQVATAGVHRQNPLLPRALFNIGSLSLLTSPPTMSMHVLCFCCKEMSCSKIVSLPSDKPSPQIK